jgi:EAL domain-containing protein (putative c-di-GMP-specific phosphodiesterase class I)
VIAEQLEDPAALDAAKRMGVDYVQGYAIARPQPLALAA